MTDIPDCQVHLLAGTRPSPSAITESHRKPADSHLNYIASIKAVPAWAGNGVQQAGAGRDVIVMSLVVCSSVNGD